MTRTSCLCGFLALCFLSSSLLADDKVTLREELRPGDTAVVATELEAKGELRTPAVLKFAAQGRLVYQERILPAGSAGQGSVPRSIRYYDQAALESTVEDRRSTMELRESIRILVAEPQSGGIFLFSPSGPITCEEKELVEGGLDILTLSGLFPPEPVAVGQTWKPADAKVAAIFRLATIKTNGLTAALESHRHNQKLAARHLGLGYHQFRNRLRKYGLI